MEYIIDNDYAEVRLDRYLRKKFPDVALGMLFKYLRTGKIKVNGKKAKENYRLQKGDIIKTFFESANSEIKEVKFIKLTKQEEQIVKENIVFENADYLVFNKPAEMVMHKGSGFDYGITEMMKSYLRNNDFAFGNRIDKATSGLIVGAKNLPALRELTELIRDRNVSKNYYVVVKGTPREEVFSIKNYLLNNGKKVIALNQEKDGAKYSETNFKLISSSKRYSILNAELVTGRKHQIRVQLASNGLPIIGDRKYGFAGKKMCLFSYKLEIKELNIFVELDVPQEFTAFMND